MFIFNMPYDHRPCRNLSDWFEYERVYILSACVVLNDKYADLHDISNEAVRYLPCIHQLADLVQGRPIRRIKSPPIEDAT